MSPDKIFQLCNGIALLGWIILIVLPMWSSSDRFILGIIITLLAIVYTYYIITNLSVIDMESFSSLAGVSGLFSNPLAILIGWVHYLAFDLVAGIWIKKNSLKHGISHWLIIPCLLLTFMFGPVGLLLYLVIRFAKTRNYFSASF